MKSGGEVASRGHDSIVENFRAYMNGFSDNVQDIVARKVCGVRKGGAYETEENRYWIRKL